MAHLKIKWGKEELDVEIEAGSTVEVFKTQVWTLTSVPVDRQKYLGFPGGMLKDTDDLAAKLSKMKAGAKVTLVGTAEGGESKAPTEKMVFEEDLTPEEKAKILKEKKVQVPPAGMKNLGNTCYMNACIQCLHRVPELRSALESYAPPGPESRDIDSALTNAFKGVLQQLRSTTESITPLPFLMTLRQKFPKFAEMQNGGYMQQDAEECMSGLLTVMTGTLSGQAEGHSKIEELFGFQMSTTLKCLECDEEPPQDNSEKQRVLLCHLGTQTEPVSHIHQGVALSLKEHVEKSSPVLGRNAQYEKTSVIDSLPPFLIVQFARFGYKGANDWAGTTASKVKLTRKCAFSGKFDVFDCASDALKKKLSVGRLKKKELEDAIIEKERQERLNNKAGSSSSSAKPSEKEGDVNMTSPSEDVEMKDSETLEEHDTGYYELISVVSHKGRTADGGHYVGWAKHSNKDKERKEDQWVLFDDETTTFYDWPDMVGMSTDLQGGKVDTQIAYLNIYKKITVKDQGQVLGSGSDKKADDADKATDSK